MHTVRIVVVKNRLPDWYRRFFTAVSEAVQAEMFTTLGIMKLRAPVLTGTLRRSIQPDQITPWHWRIVVGANYGIYVDRGTRHMGARPFFTGSIESRKIRFPIAVIRAAKSAAA